MPQEKAQEYGEAPLANLASGGIQAKVKGRNPSRQRTRKVLKSNRMRRKRRSTLGFRRI